MPSLLNPWVILGAIAVAFSVYLYGHHAGYAKKEQEDRLLIAQKNSEMNKLKDEQDVKDSETKKLFEDELNNLIAKRPRLYIPVATKSGCAATTTNNGKETAELDGQTVEDLIRLVAEGDRAIIELNSCIDRYNQVRETLSGQR
jgi:cell division protein FtsB